MSSTAIADALRADASAQVKAAFERGIAPVNLSALTEYLRVAAASPATYDSAFAAQVLLSTLLHIEDTKTVACMCLIPEKQREAKELEVVFALEDLMARGNYEQFWIAFEQAQADVEAFRAAGPSYQISMRTAIAASLANTFAAMDANVAAAMLRVPAAAVAKEIGQLGSVKDGVLTFVANDFNRPKPPPPPRDLTSDNIATVLRMA